jgi:hypothetical protein
MSRLRRLAGLAGLILVIAACSPAAAAPSAGTAASSPGAAPTASPVATTAPAAAASPVGHTTLVPAPSRAAAFTGPIPRELQGTWLAASGSCAACKQSFSFSDGAYGVFQMANSISGGPAGTQGDELSMGPVTLGCTAVGLYGWSLPTPTTLVLTPMNTDPCPRSMQLGDGHLTLVDRTQHISYAAKLTGPIPAGLIGNWEVEGSTQHIVFSANDMAGYNPDPSDVAVVDAGASGDELTVGPRHDGGCQDIGLYRWKLVSATRLLLTPINEDQCPRAPWLDNRVLVLLSRSTAPVL